MPGTNHCSADPPVSGSSGANSARKTSGCTMLKMIPKGLRSTGRSSRVSTVIVSVTGLVPVVPGGVVPGGAGAGVSSAMTDRGR
jgi:hypothetical protein